MIENQQTDSKDNKPDSAIPAKPMETRANSSRDEAANSTKELEKKKEPYWQKSLRHWLIVIFTGVLTAYTALIYTFSVNSSDEANKRSDSTLAISKISADAAKKSADAGDRMVTLSERAANRQETFAKIETRAYFNFKQAESFVLNVGKTIDISIEFTNSGKTPAYNVRTSASMKFGTGLYQHEIDSLEVKLRRKDEGATIGAGQSVFTQLPRTRTLTKDDSTVMATGILKMLVFGKIVFTDVFGVKQWTHFCFQISPDLDRMIPYERYNDASR